MLLFKSFKFSNALSAVHFVGLQTTTWTNKNTILCMNQQTLFAESLPVQQLLLTPYVPVCVCGDKVCVCVCVVWEEGGWWCIKVGGRVDRVSGTKPPPKINSVPASLSLYVQLQTCRLPQLQQQQQQRRVWGQTACHRNNMSSASSLP